ncbi:uncharacterized protein LOC116196473 isoform X2 [Punica granatum]|uniref:Uncharacterized protein LOC116196473 isoform X2 n=2 Tax=Punica granatum TaxID=22663 RepID=A0A218XXL4_PUNGR|nr:uncharacterized protein LOC116196473 isoform X2 [Punica granatum]OWM89251.1 hypothetical protein CDL15_Pgr010538 [Punica granatum]
MASNGSSKCLLTLTLSIALTAISASTVLSVYLLRSRRRSRQLRSKVRELEASLSSALEKCAAERQGRVRAQQALRKAIAEPQADNLESTSYPMRPIGVVKSCFSTRNGTPRQPLLVPLARASLIFDASRVPPASLEGLEEYSHCWIIYVFHLNTDLEKLWKHPARSKFKAKVRVPRLKGRRIGVFATRSPHRPCPIGLTIAKVEAVKGHMVLLSGVDLVDGTPVLDIKPYVPYCDSIPGATVPKWLMGDNSLVVASVNFSTDFFATLSDSWATKGRTSLYASPDDFQKLIKEVLSWDIRSVSQRNYPHDSLTKASKHAELSQDSEEEGSDENERVAASCGDILYHLLLEGLDISYRIDSNGNVFVEKATVPNDTPKE